MDKLAVGQVLLRTLRFFPFSIILPESHAYSFVYHKRLCNVRNGQCRKLTKDFISTCPSSIANRCSVKCVVEGNVVNIITTIILSVLK